MPVPFCKADPSLPVCPRCGGAALMVYYQPVPGRGIDQATAVVCGRTRASPASGKRCSFKTPRMPNEVLAAERWLHMEAEARVVTK